MVTNGFEMLSQAADTRMRVWGKTLQELFKNALRGVAFYLNPALVGKGGVKPGTGGGKIKHSIKVEAVDLNSLLIEFLSEVIANSDIENSIFTEVTFKKFGENFLEGALSGVKAEDGFEKEIKAVSYHEVDIKKNTETGMYETVLVFDI